MKGLLVKDFLLMIKSKKVILFMLFIGIIGGINDISFATGYILMVQLLMAKLKYLIFIILIEDTIISQKNYVDQVQTFVVLITKNCVYINSQDSHHLSWLFWYNKEVLLMLCSKNKNTTSFIIWRMVGRFNRRIAIVAKNDRQCRQ